jgi:hypothetical protein
LLSALLIADARLVFHFPAYLFSFLENRERVIFRNCFNSSAAYGNTRSHSLQWHLVTAIPFDETTDRVGMLPPKDGTYPHVHTPAGYRNIDKEYQKANTPNVRSIKNR